MNNILLRTLTGAIFISLVIFGLAWNSWSAFGVMGLFALLGLWEYFSIVQIPKNGPHKLIGISLGSVLFFLLSISWVFFFEPISLLAICFLLALPILIMTLELFLKKDNPLQNVALTLFGWYYIVVPLFLLAQMRGLGTFSFEAILPIGMLLIVWTNDTFAYLSGRFFGKTPLFPRISPKKTWEGTVGGIVFSMLAGLLLSYFTGIEWQFWVISALIISPAAIFGDLFESLIKRSLAIKDSGNILPGHGGILDRFDATFFATPLFFIFQLIYFYI